MKLHGIESLPCGYTIKNLTIKSKSGKSVDVSKVLSHFSTTESIKSPSIIGTLELVDTNNIVSNLPIQEGDTIDGTITVYEEDQLVYQVDPVGGWTFTFEIIRIDIFKQKKDLQVVKLHFVSPIWTNNMKGRISKSYEQVSYSDTVNEIFNEYLSGGGLNQPFGNVGALFKKTKSSLGGLGKGLGSLTSSIGGISSSLSSITQKVNSTISQVSSVANQVNSTLGQFGVKTKLNEQISKIQGKVSKTTGQINSITSQLSSITGSLSGGFNSISGLLGGSFGNFGGGIKYLEAEASDGLYNFIIPNWKPLQAIAWLAKRAIANQSSNFRFFETKDSFRFVTDTTLSQQSSVWTLYQYDQNVPFVNVRIGNMVQSNWDMEMVPYRYGNIMNFKFEDINDVNKASGNAVLGKHLITQDTTAKQITDGGGNPETGGSVKSEGGLFGGMGGMSMLTSMFNIMKGMNGGTSALAKETIDWLAGEDGEDKLAVYPTQAHQYDSGEEVNERPKDWLRQNDSMKGQIDIYNVDVIVPGNFTVKCGDIVDIVWKSQQAQPMGMNAGGIMSMMFDTCNSGNWLVKQITRNFRVGVDGYTMEMKLAKNDKNFSDNFSMLF